MSINVRDEFMGLFTEEELREIQSYSRKCVIVDNNHKCTCKVEQSSEDINIKK